MTISVLPNLLISVPALPPLTYWDNVSDGNQQKFLIDERK